MSRRSSRILLGALLLSATLPAVADAQIYVSRDSAGNLVLSDHVKDPSTVIKTYEVSKTGAFRTTKAGPRTSQSQYDALIEENAAVHGVNPHLVRAVIQQESAFNPNARSHKGAMGLMQLMPATAAELGVTDPYSPSGEHPRGRRVPERPADEICAERRARARGVQRGPDCRHEVRCGASVPGDAELRHADHERRRGSCPQAQAHRQDRGNRERARGRQVLLRRNARLGVHRLLKR